MKKLLLILAVAFCACEKEEYKPTPAQRLTERPIIELTINTTDQNPISGDVMFESPEGWDTLFTWVNVTDTTTYKLVFPYKNAYEFRFHTSCTVAGIKTKYDVHHQTTGIYRKYSATIQPGNSGNLGFTVNP